MDPPALSVVVPNYNHARHLPRCLNALFGQSVAPTEVVVVDDGSTDDSIAVLGALAKQHPRLRVVRNDQNQGVMAAVNRGVETARGDFVFLPAADDEVLPGFFEQTLRLLARYPSAGLACTAGEWREVDTGMQWHMGLGMTDRPAYLSPGEIVRLETRGRLFIPGHATVYRRAAFLEAGKLIPELRHFSDWFAILVVAFRHGACVVPEPLAVFNISREGYYQRTRRNQAENEAAIEHAFQLLAQPAYADVAGCFRGSGAFYLCGLATLRILRRRPEFRGYLTPRFLRKTLWHAARVALKRHAPVFLVNWYAGVAGYRRRPFRSGKARSSAHQARLETRR